MRRQERARQGPASFLSPAESASGTRKLHGEGAHEGAARADVVGYHVAGKTGTAHIAENGGYSTKRYISVFAGMAPATDPRLVAVVVIRDPSKGQYFAATVAAPVFSQVMTGALRLLDIPPDNLTNLTTTAYVVNLGHRS